MIKITGGVYGLRNKRGSVTYKTERDEPFALSVEEEQRLVDRGIAEYVGQPEDEPEPPVLSEKMKLAELKDIATDYGLDCSNMRSKIEVIEAIQGTANEPDDDAPELGAMEPEA